MTMQRTSRSKRKGPPMNIMKVQQLKQYTGTCWKCKGTVTIRTWQKGEFAACPQPGCGEAVQLEEKG